MMSRRVRSALGPRHLRTKDLPRRPSILGPADRCVMLNEARPVRALPRSLRDGPNRLVDSAVGDVVSVFEAFVHGVAEVESDEHA